MFNRFDWNPEFNPQLLLLLLLYMFHGWRSYGPRIDTAGLSPPLRALFWAGMILLLTFGTVDRSEQFIYFQF